MATINHSTNPNQEQKKPSIIGTWIKNLLMFLFPGIKLLKINRQLTRVSKMYDHPYFVRQRRKNMVVSFLASSPFVLSTILAGFMIVKDERLMSNLKGVKNSVISLDVSRAANQVDFVLNKKEFTGRISSALMVEAMGLGLSFVLGSLVLMLHPLLNDSKKLLKMLQNSGIVDRNAPNPLVLATPLGFLIDITGSTAREVKENDRIWMALNKRVNDWVEDPEERAIVFFKKAYSLKNQYIYKLDTK